MKGTILVYVDCADIGFRQGLELVARYNGLTNVRFMPSTKIRIQTRVDFIRLISNGRVPDKRQLQGFSARNKKQPKR